MYRSILFFSCTLLLHAVSTAAESSLPIIWSGIIEIDEGRGEKGPWQQNESRYDYVDDPTVAIDQYGNVAVAWVNQARKDVFFQRISQAGEKLPAQPINISRNPAMFSWLPRISLSPDVPGRIHILWQEIIFSGGSHGGDILFASSQGESAQFSKPLNLSRSVGGDGKGTINAKIWHNGSMDLVAGPDGAVHAAWTEYDGPLWFSQSSDGGESFSKPQHLAGGHQAKPVRGPSLALGKDRTIYLAWTTGMDDGADIHVTKSTDQGKSFGKPLLVASDNQYSDAPKLAVGPDGTLHLVYAQSNGGPFEKYQIWYARSKDGGRTFDSPREISVPMPQFAQSARFPSLSIDGAGRVYVLYELYPDYRKDPRGMGITVSLNGGNTFTTPSVVPGSIDQSGGINGSHQGHLMKKLAVNDDGLIAIVNSSLSQNRNSRVWLMRGKIDATVRSQ